MEIKNIHQHFLSTNGICTDTRKITEGCFFVAIKGDRFDGNQYAEKALELGASFALVSDLGLPKKDQFILVDDTLQTLQELATYHRRQLHIPVIAITGTNGKTTTKELMSSVLSTTYKTGFTKGNFNNHIGVPLTLLDLPLDTEIAVIEMGANHLGDIDFLCRIAEPTHGIITNVGMAHLEGFGDLEGVKQTKSELYRYLATKKGSVFVNADQDYLGDLVPEGMDTYLYGINDSSKQLNYSANYVGANPYVQLSFEDNGPTIEMQSKLFGRYNFDNLLTALAIGLHFKVPVSNIKSALENYTPSNNRSQVMTHGSNTYYLDAYNANPTSMQIALQNFGEMNETNKVVILGSMLELGTQNKPEHRKVLKQLDRLQKNKKIELQALLVGREFAMSRFLLPNAKWFDNVNQLKAWFDNQSFENHHFLIKGSRGIQLEKLVAKE